MRNRVRLYGAAVLVVVAFSVWFFGGRQETEKSSSSAAPVNVSAVAAVNAAAVANTVATQAVSSVQIPTSRGTLPYILSSTQPFDKPLRLVAEGMGAKTVASQTSKSLLIEATPAVRARLASDSRFEKVVELVPGSKIEPDLAALINEGAKEVEISILALAAADRAAVLGMLAKNGGEVLKGCLNDGELIRAKLPAEAVASLAEHGEVRWMETFVRPQLMNDLAVNAPQMNVRDVWDVHGLNGAGQAISTSDSGIDSGNLSTMHEDLRNRVKDIKVVAGCDTKDTNGHGTHTAGSIVGDGTKSGGKIRGSAWGADLYAWFCGGAGGSVYTPDTVAELYCNNGAWTTRVHSASWGSNVFGKYNAECASHDKYVWENPEFLPVFSAGNSGDYGGMSIGAPGSSKNVLTVGATQNARTGHDGGWGNGNPKRIAVFSSRGPCQDGRIKPDIAAPGVGILSTRSHGVDYSYGIYDEFYAYDSGTSMSCPLTAGAVALVRQWLVERQGFADEDGKRPTAALMKAVITGGAKDHATPNNDFGWGRVDLEQTLFPSEAAVKLVDRIPFAAGFTTNIVIVTTNEAPLDVQLAWVDYPGSASSAQTEARLVNDLDLIVESVESSDGIYMYGNGGSEPDTLNNMESVRIASAPARKYVITVDCRKILHDYTEGGAAALYIRGQFDPAATPEVPKRVHLTDRNADFYTLDSALNAVTNDNEFVTILEPEVGFLKSVTLTNSCSVTIGVDSVVRCSRGAGLTASGTGVEVVFSSVSFTNECAGLTASGGATLNASSCNFDGLASLHAEVDSTVELLGGRILGDVPSIWAEAGGSVEINYVSIGGDARSLVADGEVSLWCVDIGGSKTEDWSVSGILVLQDTQLGTNQSVSVGADGQLVLADSVKHLSSVNLAEAKRTSLTLASGALITERILVTAPGAYEKGAVFGQYECDYPTAVECGRYLVDALDPDGDLGGMPNSADGTMRWGIVEAPEAAAGAIVDDEDGTRYYYTFRSALRSLVKDSTVTIAADAQLTNAVTLAHNLKLRAKNGAVLTLSDNAQFVIPAGVTNDLADIVIAGGAKPLSDCAFKVSGGTLTLGAGTTLTGISDVHSLGKTYGGTIVITKGLFVMESGALIEDCLTHGNGGAIWVGGANSTADLRGGTIRYCTAFQNGGALYSFLKAQVRIGGDFTTELNWVGSSGNTRIGNFFLSRDTMFTLASELTGTVGVAFGKKSGLSSLNEEGANFIALDPAVSPIEAWFSAEQFTHDDASLDLLGAYDADAGLIVWAAAPPDDGQCPEEDAYVKVDVEGESVPRYYEWLEDAFARVSTNAVFYVRAPKAGEDFSDWVAFGDIEVGYRALITKWDGDGRPVIGRANESMIHVLPGGDLTLSNVVFYGVYELPDVSNSSNGLFTVEGGSLTLAADSHVGKVYGRFSRASNAVTVWKGGTLTMLPGSVIEDSFNNYVNFGDATSCGGAVLLDKSTAYLRGGEIKTSRAYRGGAFLLANKSTAYLGGEFKATTSTDLNDAKDNFVIADKSQLILDGEFSGSLGCNEGIAASTNRFGTVLWDWPSDTALAGSAAKFTHDKTGAYGVAVTNSVDKRAILVWSDWIAKTGVYVDEDGTEYYPCTPGGPQPVDPTPFSIMISPIDQDRKCVLTLVGAVNGCWYELQEAESLEAPVTFTFVKEVHQASTNAFSHTVDTTLKPAKFYKVIGKPGIPEE